MKVLQVVHQFLPKYVGGTELYTAQLSRWLVDRGHSVEVFCGGDAAGRGRWEGVPVTTVPGGLRGPRGVVRSFMASFGDRETEDAFVERVEQFRPDVVHFQHLAGLSGRLPQLTVALGLPSCYTLHDYWFTCPKSQLINHASQLCNGPVAGLNCGLCAAERLGHASLAVAAPLVAPLFMKREDAVRRAVSAASVILAPSRFLAGVAEMKGLPREKVKVVDFGVAEDVRAADREPPAAGAPLRVVYLGAIEWSKGVHVLLEACSRMEPGSVDVRIYGDPLAYPEYSRWVLARARGLPADFRGPVSRDAIPRVLAAAGVVVVPSLWYENAPLVIAEAFAAGVPVVASRCGALSEKVTDGLDGLLFPRGDPDGLAQALGRLAGNRGLVEELRRGIRRQATRSAHFEEMERIYQGLVAENAVAERAG